MKYEKQHFDRLLPHLEERDKRRRRNNLPFLPVLVLVLVLVLVYRQDWTSLPMSLPSLKDREYEE